MIWKMIGATAIFFILWSAFFAFVPGISGVDNSLLNGPWGAVTRNGVSVNNIASESFYLWAAGMALALIFDIIYVVVSSQEEETNSFVEGIFQ